MGTFIIGGILILLVIIAISKIRKDTKNGGCTGCSQSANCNGSCSSVSKENSTL